MATVDWTPAFDANAGTVTVRPRLRECDAGFRGSAHGPAPSGWRALRWQTVATLTFPEADQTISAGTSPPTRSPGSPWSRRR